MDIQESLKNKIKNISEEYVCDKTGGYITGDGPIPCDILFIGEAPGKNEVEEGKPFVGMAGKNFEKYLNSIGLKREFIRITNTCFFRPIKIKEGKNGRISISNRPPKVSEISLFSSILDEEINLVNPKLIITLGNVPLKRLTSFKSIGDCHGNIYFIENLNRYVFPMYHPSALTYNRSEEFHKIYENDWVKLREALDKI
ncbi:uracil-DNA glycosylase [Clostridium botulinum]|uniref:uracil-DNA glycosylase n=1 Tax=Clostridium botulinum TaxID=1491 RepID=UPI0013FC81F0|nr:uracil-DNA glycosylase [Clostridium botulinum]MBN3411041.1 uracil-DNA glycosylase [Clostridium botulinum]MBY6798237.1 uracil-DNA glycosylase [Clostridium botulinum]MBY6867995.1 uracil-DNA glycosylase [Clostridium botulinum]MBY6875153.1 uracil-DNA glycosylase [Clostridium botulinum]MBY6889787.1 uracil-DNA glycosylase [Clostridium botulinum]